MSSSGWIFVFLSAAFVVAANLLLRAGVDRAGGFPGNLSTILPDLLNLGKQPAFDIGVILYALASVVWFKVLSTEPLSIAYPVLVSATFVMISIGAIFFFRESINLIKVIGMALIVTGIFVVSRA
jgi:multidrug transporter EmrE-like cation transporter